MFICERCQRLSSPGEARRTVVVQTRVHVHPARFRERDGKRELVDKGGTGTQIVRERRVCADCAEIPAV